MIYNSPPFTGSVLPEFHNNLENSSPRDRHFFGPGPKRILSLDGGGVRGIIALAFLARLEDQLSQAQGSPVLLCDHFDLIGGTSTGGIIATALALGYTTREIRDFYLTMGPRIFRKPRLRLPGWQSKFDAAALRTEIARIVGDRELGSGDLKTGLAVMLKRIDAGGAWIVSNNPRAKFWETPADDAFLGNRHYKLEAIVRASTAAPSFFDLQAIEIAPNGPVGLFVDGGLTAHNDPSLALLMLATLPPHGIQWTLGADRLEIVSIGTGAFRQRADPRALLRASAFGIALRSLTQQIAESQQLTLTLMSWLGKGGAPWPINSEIGDFAGAEPPFGALFNYKRYDVRLEADWLQAELGLEVGMPELLAARRFDNPDAMPFLDRIAQAAALKQMPAPA